MEKLRIVRLVFKSPLHIHNSRADYAETLRQIHSDTIYSAIIQMLGTLSKEEFIRSIGQFDENSGNIPFTISSLFPFANSKSLSDTDKIVYFLPRPKKQFNNVAIETNFSDDKKKIKKIEWLDVLYFTDQIKNIDGASPEEKDIYDTIYLSKSELKFSSSQKIESKIIYTDSSAHASIPREQGKIETTPYIFERLHFSEGCGFYFLLKCDDYVLEIIKPALDLLKDEGIGSDRNLGNGQFEYTVIDNIIETLQFENLFRVESDYKTNLSLFIPENKEELVQMLPTSDKKIGYELVKRGGWVTTVPYLSLHKNAVFMFSEGSVFKMDKTECGKTINVKPNFEVNHPIWRVGKSFFVPIVV